MLAWQTIIYSAIGSWHCLESYDSLHDRLRDGQMKEAEGGIHWVPPLELTVRGEGDEPVRLLLQPHAVVGVLDIPEHAREALEMPS